MLHRFAPACFLQFFISYTTKETDFGLFNVTLAFLSFSVLLFWKTNLDLTATNFIGDCLRNASAPLTHLHLIGSSRAHACDLITFPANQIRARLIWMTLIFKPIH